MIACVSRGVLSFFLINKMKTLEQNENLRTLQYCMYVPMYSVQEFRRNYMCVPVGWKNLLLIVTRGSKCSFGNLEQEC